MEQKIPVTSNDVNKRLDLFICEKVPEWISRTFIQKSIKDGQILVNSEPKKPGYRLRQDDVIVLELPEKPAPHEVTPQDIPLDIVYEDHDIIVINKEAGMVVHPSGNCLKDTMVNALLFHCPEIQRDKNDIRPGIVHRLDKDTSGLIVVAKNEASFAGLSDQFRDRTIRKSYLALVKGQLIENEGSIDAPIGRHPQIRIKMAVVVDGKPSLTEFKVLRRFGSAATLVSVVLKTGRTHQIRVHFSYLGFPLMGDEVYGRANEDRKYDIFRQMLHAYRLELIHPATGRKMIFTAPLADDFCIGIKNVYRMVE
ncbi:MAG TPA: RluA family pseudouridine synthase [Petrotogaceae bacterium]|nr:RluA family pseudouridine synthase [Petrotogaceae bacterium]HNY36455.1 RluA family pseudouridine synthase [Petrotogaceae bacterium]HOG34449.1 RluA family pseudouridine synthase [Petrotogaceae bacterium]HPO26502.1 RluA family pseudouridine synthase [Petrotogaceae bacterium]HPX15062.1 RluA family pseudouridine synthase [Petrotogaceae bacterium]